MPRMLVLEWVLTSSTCAVPPRLHRSICDTQRDCIFRETWTLTLVTQAQHGGASGFKHAQLTAPVKACLASPPPPAPAPQAVPHTANASCSLPCLKTSTPSASADLLDAPDSAHEQVPVQVRARAPPQIQLGGNTVSVGVDCLQPFGRCSPGDC